MPQRRVWKNKQNNASLGNNNNNTNRRMTPAKAGSCGDCLLWLLCGYSSLITHSPNVRCLLSKLTPIFIRRLPSAW